MKLFETLKALMDAIASAAKSTKDAAELKQQLAQMRFLNRTPSPGFMLANGESVFTSLINEGHHDAVTRLLHCGGSKNHALFAYAKAQDEQQAQGLLREGANLRYAIQGYIQSNEPKLVIKGLSLCRTIIDVQYALKSAALANNAALVYALLKTFPKIDAFWAMNGYAINANMDAILAIRKAYPRQDTLPSEPWQLVDFHGKAGLLPTGKDSDYLGNYVQGLFAGGHTAQAFIAAAGQWNMEYSLFGLRDPHQTKPKDIQDLIEKGFDVSDEELKTYYKAAVVGAIRGNRLELLDTLSAYLTEEDKKDNAFKQAIAVACWSEKYDFAVFGQTWSMESGASAEHIALTIEQILSQLAKANVEPVACELQKQIELVIEQIKVPQLGAAPVLKKTDLLHFDTLASLMDAVAAAAKTSKTPSELRDIIATMRFLDRTVSPSFMLANGDSVFSLLAQSGDFQAMERLLEAGASKNHALFAYAKQGNHQAVLKLIQQGATVRYAVQGYVQSNNEKWVQKGLQLCTTASDFQYALKSAALAGNDELVQQLLVNKQHPCSVLWAMSGYAISANMDKVREIAKPFADNKLVLGLRSVDWCVYAGLAAEDFPEYVTSNLNDTVNKNYYRRIYHSKLFERGHVTSALTFLQGSALQEAFAGLGLFDKNQSPNDFISQWIEKGYGLEAIHQDRLKQPEDALHAVIGAIRGNHLGLINELAPLILDNEENKKQIADACWSEYYDQTIFNQDWTPGEREPISQSVPQILTTLSQAQKQADTLVQFRLLCGEYLAHVNEMVLKKRGNQLLLAEKKAVVESLIKAGSISEAKELFGKHADVLSKSRTNIMWRILEVIAVLLTLPISLPALCIHSKATRGTFAFFKPDSQVFAERGQEGLAFSSII